MVKPRANWTDFEVGTTSEVVVDSDFPNESGKGTTSLEISYGTLCLDAFVQAWRIARIFQGGGGGGDDGGGKSLRDVLTWARSPARRREFIPVLPGIVIWSYLLY